MSGAQGSAADGRVVFISHTTRDDAFVAKLRARLETRGYTVLEDSQFFAGEELPAQVRDSIDRAATVIAVGSKKAAGSAWVRRELRYARRGDRPKRTIPLIFDDGSTADLRTILGLPQPRTPEDDLDEWPADLIGIRVPDGAGALDALLPGLLDALEGRAGGGKIDIGESRPTSPLADLVLRLRATRFELVDGNRRPVATASLAFYPPGADEPSAESPEFPFAAPLGKIEAGDLRFYLERYFLTPFGEFAKRARHIEAQLPEWGQDLWDALRAEEDDRVDAVRAWQGLAATAQRRFTVQAPPQTKLRRTASEEDKAAQREAQEASTEILALPWELLHDGHGYIFHDGIGARVRRSLPGGVAPAKLDEAARKPPLRVLAVCARPEKLIEMDDGKEHKSDVGYIDHRISIRPLTEALNALGDLADYTILSPPTFPALCDALKSALEAGRPYHIVHFDGHGVFRKATGLGALVFEHPDDAKTGKLRQRNAEVVGADVLGERLRHAGVGLFFLEACQSAQSIRSPEASVAGSLLQSGIGSVAAMSHSVLVETAKQFTAVFYPALAAGARVGAAMLKGQIALERERQRGWGWEPREGEPGKIDRRPLALQDWFVPVLYQDGEDPVLLADIPGERVRRALEKDRALALGKLPPPPQHAFVGRSRELLAAERLLVEASKGYVVLRGEGGEGKTTLAVELARWLVATRRFARAAFASAENLPAEENAARAVLVAWGTQLDPNFAGKADTLEHAEAALAAALEQQPTILVLDNLETILPPPEGSEAAGARDFDQARLDAVLAACAHLLERAPRARILFTSRETLPTSSPFGDVAHVLEVGRLGKDEGMELVARVLAQNAAQSGGGAVHAEALQAEREEEIAALVTTVNGHARSLVLLTPELARRGLRATTAELAEIMADLELRYPGERERSLFASLELSLRRLPKEVREKLAPLGVVEGGNCLLAMQMLLEVDPQTGFALGNLLAQVGLCEMIGVVENPSRPSDIFLRFDPALAPALLRELRERGSEAEAAARSLWSQAYRTLAGFLYQQRSKDPHLAAHLTRLELPNLLGALRHLSAAYHAEAAGAPAEAGAPDAATRPEAVVDFATDVEGLLANLGRREALAETSAIRTRAAQLLELDSGGALTHAAFIAADAGVDRLLEFGRFREAVDVAGALAEKTDRLADDAYLGAAYDRAMAQFSLGRALKWGGAPGSALTPLATARERFEALAARGNAAATRMASVCLQEVADCLCDLGQLDPAAAKYEEAIEGNKKRGDLRSVATGTFQLGTVRLLQRRHPAALQAYAEARSLFESLNEPKSVGAIWHQIGVVHQGVGQIEEAESAYQRSLAMKMQAGDKPGEASTRGQLGNLYVAIPGRREEAVVYFRQAAEIYAAPETADPMKEGFSCGNAATALASLGRFDEARAELARAIECKSQFGANAEPWKTWDILHNLERATGNPAAAEQARAKAIAAYAAARRAGWEITQGVVAQLGGHVRSIAIAKDPATPDDALPPEVRAQLPQLEAQLRQELAAWSRDPDTRADLRALAPPLLAILDGSRDPALAEVPTLHYADAVELTLLLEQLTAL